MKTFLMSILAASLFFQSTNHGLPGTHSEQNTPPEKRVLPLEELREKGAVEKLHREALDSFNSSKLEREIASLKDGDIYRQGDHVYSSKEELLQAIKERNKTIVDKYKLSLPMDGEFYVVEGDLLLTDNEIPIYLGRTSRVQEYDLQREGDSSLNIYDGEDDYYRTVEKRKLTYAIDKTSLSAEQYQQIASDMIVAAGKWQEMCNGCGLEFTDIGESRADSSQSRPNFIVRAHDAQGVYLASAFFPHHGSERRYLNLDPLYFSRTVAERTGVLTHQLGHVLGYRHTQTKGLASCYYKGKFLSLSSSKETSLMRYFCSGDTALPSEPAASEVAFHVRTYDLPKVNTASGSLISNARNVLVTQYEGGNVASNVASTLSELVKLQLVSLGRHKVVGDKETVSSIYQSHLQLPLYSGEIFQLANELNGKGLKDEVLPIGTEVLYPNVKFNVYERTVVWDPSSTDGKAFEQDLHTRNLFIRKTTSPLPLLTMSAFELRVAVDSDQALKQAVDSLGSMINRSNIRNVAISAQEATSTPLDDKKPQQQYFSYSSSAAGNAPTDRLVQQDPSGQVPTDVQNVSAFFNDLDMNKPRVGVEGGLRYLANMATVPQALKLYRCNPETNCPEILLIDTEVYPHPELYGAYKRLYRAIDGTSITPEFQRFSTDQKGLQAIRLANRGPYKADHGTYMAGIIASRANGYGIVGLAPDGQIYSVDWETYGKSRSELVKLLAEREENGRVTGKQQIVVLATNWRLRDDTPGETANSRLDRETDRWTDALARFIQKSSLLVVAAVGQPEENEQDKRPKEIDPRFPEGPMNLGDLDNVIIVTACEDCYGDSPRLYGMANLAAKNAENMVHVAAPGSDIPSTIKPVTGIDAWYAKGTGTSPATAMVAGVVFEMISYWPNSYRISYDIKKRLQLTSRPVILNDAGTLRLMVGVLDPVVALSDPSKNWLVEGESWIDISDFRWTADRINVRVPESNDPDLIRTKDILRIRKIERDRRNYWVFYTKKKDSRSEIERRGPFLIDADQEKKIFMTVGLACSSGDRREQLPGYSLEQITDLILAKTNDKVSCAPITASP